MAIPILATFSTAIILSPVLWLLVRLTRPGLKRTIGIALIGVAFLFLITPALQILLAMTTAHGVDVSASEVPFDLPHKVRNVCFWSSDSSTRLVVEFDIAENDFNKWMDDNNRPTRDIK